MSAESAEPSLSEMTVGAFESVTCADRHHLEADQVLVGILLKVSCVAIIAGTFERAGHLSHLTATLVFILSGVPSDRFRTPTFKTSRQHHRLFRAQNFYL